MAPGRKGQKKMGRHSGATAPPAFTTPARMLTLRSRSIKKVAPTTSIASDHAPLSRQYTLGSTSKALGPRRKVPPQPKVLKEPRGAISASRRKRLQIAKRSGAAAPVSTKNHTNRVRTMMLRSRSVTKKVAPAATITDNTPLSRRYALVDISVAQPKVLGRCGTGSRMRLKLETKTFSGTPMAKQQPKALGPRGGNWRVEVPPQPKVVKEPRGARKTSGPKRHQIEKRSGTAAIPASRDTNPVRTMTLRSRTITKKKVAPTTTTDNTQLSNTPMAKQQPKALGPRGGKKPKTDCNGSGQHAYGSNGQKTHGEESRSNKLKNGAINRRAK